MDTVEISAFDAGRSQLETSINLFIDGTDLLSSHVLACSAAEVINKLLKHGGEISVFDHLKENKKLFNKYPFDIERKFSDAHNEHVNFFKHGGLSDKYIKYRSGNEFQPLSIIEYKKEITFFILIEAISAYSALCDANIQLPEGGLPYTPAILSLSMYCCVVFEEVLRFSIVKSSFEKIMPNYLQDNIKKIENMNNIDSIISLLKMLRDAFRTNKGVITRSVGKREYSNIPK